jgi:hypothetical protein
VIEKRVDGPDKEFSHVDVVFGEMIDEERLMRGEEGRKMGKERWGRERTKRGRGEKKKREGFLQREAVTGLACVTRQIGQHSGRRRESGMAE